MTFFAFADVHPYVALLLALMGLFAVGTVAENVRKSITGGK